MRNFTEPKQRGTRCCSTARGNQSGCIIVGGVTSSQLHCSCGLYCVLVTPTCIVVPTRRSFFWWTSFSMDDVGGSGGGGCTFSANLGRRWSAFGWPTLPWWPSTCAWRRLIALGISTVGRGRWRLVCDFNLLWLVLPCFWSVGWLWRTCA